MKGSPKKLLRVATRVVLVGLLLFFGAVALLVFDGLNDHLEDSDVCLILGNTVHPNGVVSDRLKARLERAYDLYQEERVGKLLVSGALGKEGHDEALVMRDYLVAKGVPPSDIIVDSEGWTTYASAKNASELAAKNGFRSVTVVTQYFHIPRSRYALKRFGMNPVYTAHAHHFEWRDLYSIPRELLGFASYFLKSY